jgi:acetyl esterase
MSVFSRPRVARTIARSMQALTRAAATRMTSTAQARLPEFPGHTTKIVVPTALGPAAATAYWPAPTSTTPSPVASSAPLTAVHINLHGGGYVLDIADMDDPLCRAVAAASGAVVLNVRYVVAPQHPFPAAAHQVYEIVRWVAANGANHGWDGTRLTLGGQSAGGGLTAAAARLAFEDQWPGIALQVLHYPPLDLSVPAASKHSALDKPALRPWAGEVYDTAYVPDSAERTDRLVSPAGSADIADLRGMPPAVVIAAEHDILRDEAARYAARLDAAGALVEYHEVAGADHGYDLNNDALARSSYAFIAAHIQRATA